MAQTDPAARTLAIALLVALWIEVLVRAFALLFLLNFSTEGPNATAVLALLLASGFLLALRGPSRWGPAMRRHLLIALAAAGLAVSMVGTARTALAGALVFLAASLPWLRTVASGRGRLLPMAAVLGVLLHQALRAGLDGAPLHAPGAGTVVLAVAAAAWVVLSWRLAAPDGRDGSPSGPAMAPLVAFVWAQAAFVGSTQAVTAWVPAEAVPVVVFGGLGLWAGASWGHRVPVQAAGLAVLAGVAALLWTQSTWPAVFLAQAGLAACLAHGCHARIRHDGAVTAAVQMVLTALVFLHVAAVNWAFVGFLPTALTQGRSAAYLLLATMVLPILAAAHRPAERAEVPA